MHQNYKPNLISNMQQRTVYLMEECAELIQACAKSLRHGLYSTNPELPLNQRESNIDWMLREINDVKYAISLIEAEYAVPKVEVNEHD